MIINANNRVSDKVKIQICLSTGKKLFDKIYKDKNRPVRRIAYDFDALVSERNEQYDLFTDNDKIEKEKKLVFSVLSLREKYGKNSILKGLDLQKDATQRERNKLVGGHNG